MKSKEPNLEEMPAKDSALTLDIIKDCIEFDRGSEVYKILNRMVDCWYSLALIQGKTEQAALKETLYKLIEKILEISNRKEIS